MTKTGTYDQGGINGACTHSRKQLHQVAGSTAAVGGVPGGQGSFLEFDRFRETVVT